MLLHVAEQGAGKVIPALLREAKGREELRLASAVPVCRRKEIVRQLSARDDGFAAVGYFHASSNEKTAGAWVPGAGRDVVEGERGGGVRLPPVSP